MDWKSSLEALKADLPAGEEGAGETAPSTAPDGEAYASQPRLDVLLDRKGRRGKEATIVAGFTLPDDEVTSIASRLKQKLGTGGSARGGEILIQGDKRAAVADALRAMGLKCRVI